MEVVPVERTITSEAKRELQEQEAILTKAALGFVEEGDALRVISDKKLYRVHHRYATFDEYVRQYWDESPARAYQKINASGCHQHLHNCGETRLPDNEAQCRELLRLKPELWLEAWRKVVKRVGSGTITARIVRMVVETLSPAIEVQKPTSKSNRSAIEGPSPEAEPLESLGSSSQAQEAAQSDEALTPEARQPIDSEGVTSIDEKFLEAWNPFWRAMEALMAAVGQDVVEDLICNALPSRLFEDDESDSGFESPEIREISSVESQCMTLVCSKGGTAK